MANLSKYYPYNVTSETLIEVVTSETTTKINKNFQLNTKKEYSTVIEQTSNLFNALSNDTVTSVNLTTAKNSANILTDEDITLVDPNGNSPVVVNFKISDTTKNVIFRIANDELKTKQPPLYISDFFLVVPPATLRRVNTFGITYFARNLSGGSYGEYYYYQVTLCKSPSVDISIGDHFVAKGNFQFSTNEVRKDLFEINIVE